MDGSLTTRVMSLGVTLDRGTYGVVRETCFTEGGCRGTMALPSNLLERRGTRRRRASAVERSECVYGWACNGLAAAHIIQN